MEENEELYGEVMNKRVIVIKMNTPLNELIDKFLDSVPEKLPKSKNYFNLEMAAITKLIKSCYSEKDFKDEYLNQPDKKTHSNGLDVNYSVIDEFEITRLKETLNKMNPKIRYGKGDRRKFKKSFNYR